MASEVTVQAYLARCAGRRFRYGSHDCGLFVAGWIEARTGRNPAQGLEYATRKQAEALLAEDGFASLADLADAHLAPVPPLMAQTGDVALVRGRAFGIVDCENVHVLRPDGLGVVPLTAATHAWRVA